MLTKKHFSKKKNNKNNKNKSKKWKTAFQAADVKFRKTKSIVEARKSLRQQALTNARKLFGSI